MVKEEEERKMKRFIIRKDCVEKFRCKTYCYADHTTCKTRAMIIYDTALGGCYFCPSPPVACVCVAIASAALATAIYYCNKDKNTCLARCDYIYCEYD